VSHEEQLLYDYPSVRITDLTNVRDYYAYHQDEIDQQFADNENIGH